MSRNCIDRLTIIVVNWNAGHYLRDCIASISIVKQEGFTISDVIVVDNGSIDGSLDGLDQLGTPVHVIKNTENFGFAAACNQGAAVATGNYFLFLNPDTRLFCESLAKPMAFMRNARHSRVGICGIRLVDEEANAVTSAARFPTLRVMAGRTLGLTKLFPGVFPAHFIPSDDLRKNSEVDQVIGAFFLIRKNVFDQCAGFDERFFVYFEEVDLSLRAKHLGYSSYYLPDVTAFHKGGGCSDRVKALRLFYSLSSRIRYARKHYSRIEFVALVSLTGLEFPLRLIQGAAKASWGDIHNTCVAYARLVISFVRRTRWD